MKSKFLFVLLILTGTSAFCQIPVVLDSVFAVIKNKSVYRTVADWNRIEAGWKDRLRSVRNDVDSVASLTYVFEQLGDVHSFINYRGRSFANYPAFDDSTRRHLIPLVTKSQEQTGIIKTAVLQEKYAYIQVPGINAWGEQASAYAQAIADSICRLHEKEPKGFIIDLRLNGGGQLSSMLSGLNLLLGNTYLGGGVNADGAEEQKFEIIDGNFCINAVPMTSMRNHCNPDLSNKPVVVVIGPVTRSSGSITAIAFKQRTNTFFIGEPTADGYSTGNDYFYLGPSFDMNLSTHFSRDRTRNLYKNTVAPDLVVSAGDDFEQLLSDKKIIAAIRWFENN